MVITPSEVSSLACTLTRWEDAEYFFAGLVTLACFGEFVAEFTNWFTKGIEHRKKHLEKFSTLVLVGALAFELVCLVRTNILSSKLIGSLSEQSQGAVDKSQKALSDASAAISRSKVAEGTALTAVDKSDKANTASRGALDKSAMAQRSATSALDLAKGARQEADSAVQARRELERLTAPRLLSVFQRDRIITKLVPFGQQFFALMVYPDPESLNLARTVDEMLKAAGWKRVPSQIGDVTMNVAGENAGEIFDPGVQSFTGPDNPEAENMSAVLSLALSAEDIPCESHRNPQLSGKTPKAITVAIGRKPVSH
jgi:hypothetical protein